MHFSYQRGILFVAAACTVACQKAHSQCYTNDITSIPINIVDARPIIPVAVNGRVFNMTADTGAALSVIAYNDANAAEAQDVTSSYVWMHETGGGFQAKVVTASKISLGSLVLSNVRMLRPDKRLGISEGLLGNDIIGQFIFDFDFQNKKLNILAYLNCKTNINNDNSVYKQLLIKSHQSPTFKLRIGNYFYNTVLDTGSAVSQLSRLAYTELGKGGNATTIIEKAGQIGGISGKQENTSLVSVKGITLGTCQLGVQRLRMSKSQFENVDIIVGMDILHKFHLTIDGPEKYALLKPISDKVCINPYLISKKREK